MTNNRSSALLRPSCRSHSSWFPWIQRRKSPLRFIFVDRGANGEIYVAGSDGDLCRSSNQLHLAIYSRNNTHKSGVVFLVGNTLTTFAAPSRKIIYLRSSVSEYLQLVSPGNRVGNMKVELLFAEAEATSLPQ